MAWDVLSRVINTAWDVMSGVTKNSMGCFVRGGKSLWDVLSAGMFCPAPSQLRSMTASEIPPFPHSGSVPCCYLRRFSESRPSSGSTPSVRPQDFRGTKFV